MEGSFALFDGVLLGFHSGLFVDDAVNGSCGFCLDEGGEEGGKRDQVFRGEEPGLVHVEQECTNELAHLRQQPVFVFVRVDPVGVVLVEDPVGLEGSSHKGGQHVVAWLDVVDQKRGYPRDLVCGGNKRVPWQRVVGLGKHGGREERRPAQPRQSLQPELVHVSLGEHRVYVPSKHTVGTRWSMRHDLAECIPTTCSLGM